MFIKKAFIVPAVFVLCIAGSYADRKFIFDMYLCLIAGVIGILMAKNHKGGLPHLRAIFFFRFCPCGQWFSYSSAPRIGGVRSSHAAGLVVFCDRRAGTKYCSPCIPAGPER
ncbi:MAG: tripartite tricarboxylate transporter permease [Spirochaetia bacterium]|nr:tripartite tricarboxylate transporter permease [Spirochaetia bacterium]